MTSIRRVADELAHAPRSAAARILSRRPAAAIAAGPAWDAWRGGNFALARERAADALATGRDVDDARHVLALVAAVLGDYEEAIATHELISPRYRHLADLDEPILSAYVHRDDLAGALSFAERRGVSRRSVGRETHPPGAGASPPR